MADETKTIKTTKSSDKTKKSVWKSGASKPKTASTPVPLDTPAAAPAPAPAPRARCRRRG